MAEVFSNIQLHRVIVHQINHLTQKTPLYSDFPSEVSKEAASFIELHIRNSLEHRFTRDASFDTNLDGKNAMADIAKTILNRGEKTFIRESKVIAERLFLAMKDDKRISPGDLLICTYSDLKENDDVRLALLKMDPEAGFRRRRQKVNGGYRTVLERIDSVLPTNSQELQKCAFIMPDEKGALTLRVLDQQAARYGQRRMVASFFLVKFLLCKVATDIRFQTRVFVNRGFDWMDKKTDIWPSEEIQDKKEALRNATLRDQLDITAFAHSEFEDTADQDEFVDFMRSAGITDLAFPPDPTEKERVGQTRRFLGDDGVDLSINSEAYKLASDEDPDPDATVVARYDSATNTYTLTIHTDRWIEVPPRRS